MYWSNFNYLFQYKNDVYLLYNSLSNILLELDESNYNELLNLKSNLSLIENHPDHDFLFENKIIVKSDEDEVNRLKVQILAQRFNSSILHLIIAPTQECNFNCEYCFEDSRFGENMGIKVQNKIIDFIRIHENIRKIQLTWYGGEPLVAFNEMKSIVKKISKLKIVYNSKLITNGFNLTNEIVDQFDIFNFNHIQITLDGNKDTHNKRRPHIDGSNTYSKIIENIDNFLKRKQGIKLSIRVNIDKTNKDEFIEVYKMFKAKYQHNKNFHVYPGYIEKDESSCRNSVCISNNYEKILFNKHISEMGAYDKSIYPILNFHSCMARTLNSYLIGPDGAIYKCLKNLGDKTKCIGNIKKPDELNTLLMSKFLLKNDYLLNKKCSECFYFPLCMGGCALTRSGLEKSNVSEQCTYTKGHIESYISMHYENTIKNN